MEEAYTVGIRLGTEDGVSVGIAALSEQMAALKRGGDRLAGLALQRQGSGIASVGLTQQAASPAAAPEPDGEPSRAAVGECLDATGRAGARRQPSHRTGVEQDGEAGGAGRRRSAPPWLDAPLTPVAATDIAGATEDLPLPPTSPMAPPRASGSAYPANGAAGGPSLALYAATAPPPARLSTGLAVRRRCRSARRRCG
jgi:hypothetical protein